MLWCMHSCRKCSMITTWYQIKPSFTRGWLMFILDIIRISCIQFHGIYHIILTKKNLNVRFYRRICLYVTHLHKDYVLWCYKNTNNFEGNRDNVYLSQLFVRFLLFYRKAILGRDRKCLVETGSPSDSCTGECRKKNPRIVFYSFCFSRVFYELIYCLGKSHHK